MPGVGVHIGDGFTDGLPGLGDGSVVRRLLWEHEDSLALGGTQWYGTGETAHQLRVLDTLTEAVGSVLSTTQ